jgi:hypothetical protein
MTDAVVTGAGFRVVKNLGGRKYTVAALSYGEAGRMSEASAVRMRPPQAVILEEIRQALHRAGKSEMTALVDEFEAAEIHFQATVLAYGGSGQDGKAEVAEARERLLRAQVRQRTVEWLTRDDPELQQLRTLDNRLGREEHLAVLAASLRGWEGPEMPAFPGDGLDADFINERLPAGDVAALGSIALTLMSPTKEAAGN